MKWKPGNATRTILSRLTGLARGGRWSAFAIALAIAAPAAGAGDMPTGNAADAEAGSIASTNDDHNE